MGYKGTVTISPCQLSCQTTFPHPVQAFAQAVTSKLETSGLLVLSYKISKQTSGRNQFFCQFTLQAVNSFPSKNAIVAVVTSAIVQETNATVYNPQDPPVISCGSTGTYCTCTGTCQLGGLATQSVAPALSTPGACAKPWCCQLNWWQKFTSSIHNAIYGTLSTCQKNAVVSQGAGELVNAGVDPTAAIAASGQSATSNLTANNADPSQSNFFASAGFQKVLPFLALGFGLLILVVVLQFVGLWKTANA